LIIMSNSYYKRRSRSYKTNNNNIRRGGNLESLGRGEEEEDIGVIYKRGDLEGEFKALWKERQKERQRVYKSLKERQRKGRKIKKVGQRRIE
jgi:hypothetical protein